MIFYEYFQPLRFQMRQVVKDEGVDISSIIQNISNNSFIIPKNIARKQHIIPTGIGKGLKTKAKVNIRTSTLHQNINEKVSTNRISNRQ